MKILKFHNIRVRYTQFLDNRVFFGYAIPSNCSKYEKKVIFMWKMSIFVVNGSLGTHFSCSRRTKIPKFHKVLAKSTLFEIIYLF